MSCPKTAPATINILLSFGIIYNLTAPSIKKKFSVKSGDSSFLLGALNYTDAAALSGDQVGTTSTENNKLVVTFVKDKVQTGKFISSNDLPDSVVVIDNTGTWTDTDELFEIPQDFGFGRVVVPVPNPNIPAKKNKLGFEYQEHCLIGDAIRLKLANGSDVPASIHPFELDNKLSLTYGQINGLGPDFYGTDEPICEGINWEDRKRRFRRAFGTLADVSYRQPGEANDILYVLKDEIDKVNAAVAQGQDPSVVYSKLPDQWKTFERITKDRPKDKGQLSYLGLLKINFDHFGWDARNAYETGHAVAIQRALEGDVTKQKDLDAAYALNAFADHFLEDSFSAGHLRTPRRMLSGTLARNYCAKRMHDEDNAIGLSVRNPAGVSWTAFGDKRALDAEDRRNKDYCIQAVQQSADEIYDAFRDKRVPTQYKALDYAPTLESAAEETQQLAPLFRAKNQQRYNVENRRKWRYKTLWSPVLTLMRIWLTRRWVYPIKLDWTTITLPWSSIAVTTSLETHIHMFCQHPGGDIVETKSMEGIWTGAGRPNKPIIKAVMFTPLAAISWNGGKEVRIYYLDEGYLLQEYCFSTDRGQWFPGMLGDLKIRGATNTSIAATQYTDAGGIVYIRLYCQESGSTIISEFRKEANQEWFKSTTSRLPIALSGSSIAAVTYNDGSEVHIFYQDEELSIREHRFLKNEWYDGSLYFLGAPGCVPISAVLLANSKMCVYWLNVQNDIISAVFRDYYWDSLTRILGHIKPGNQFAVALYGKQQRLYFQAQDDSIIESCNSGDTWTGGATVAIGHLQEDED